MLSVKKLSVRRLRKGEVKFEIFRAANCWAGWGSFLPGWDNGSGREETSISPKGYLKDKKNE